MSHFQVVRAGFGLIRRAVALFVLAAGLAPLTLAGAQQPAPVPNVAGTTWSGQEKLRDFGPLSFTFQADGKAIMTDAATPRRGTIKGDWTQKGADVEFRFKDCVYRGRINGRQLSGTAQFYDRPEQPWTFELSLLPPAPPGPAAPR
jgi:hypothetical protein